MKSAQIIAHRLGNQRLTGTPFRSPQEVVRHFGAMQAQDYHGAKWAVGQRCGASDAGVEALFNAGHILRTHLCRPTWHFVAPEDIRWILGLTAPRVHQANAFMCRKHGLDAKLLKRSTDLIARALEGGKHKDRDALMTVFKRACIDTSEFRSTYFMMHAELEGVVCSGPRVGKKFTYALLEERVPKAKEMERDEALAELTRRYFTSRGPATLNDYALWSGLTMADAKKGIAVVEKEFERVTINERNNWYPRDREAVKVPPNTVHLLPNYDEYGIGYKDRSAFHDPELARHSGSRNNPVFRNLLVVGGRMMGTWDRTLKAREVSVTTSLFAPVRERTAQSIDAAIRRYTRFLGMPLRSTKDKIR